MNAFQKPRLLLAALLTATTFAATATADPLPGRDLLKFGQRPMVQTSIFGQTFEGHDELSTAYAPISTIQPAPPNTQYRGVFMADDFADTLSTPVVHVKWWGSYMNQSLQHGHIQKFLIAFENDVPAGTGMWPFSYPDPNGPIHSQIVTVTTNPLTPQSGQFTEKLINVGTVGVVEDLYEYNAELAIPFPQQADTVHWLKIVALVDHAQNIIPGTPGAAVPQWGWHNRDYTQQNTSSYVSTVPLPGENQQGNPAQFPIWHFQDDAVSGQINVNTITNTSGVQQIAPVNGVVQFDTSFNDEYYIDNIDGIGNGIIPGFQGISQYSKDLAFELYTVQVPEPASLALMAAGFAGAVACQRRMRKA